MRAQQLARRSAGSAPDAVHGVLALQAQDAHAARLSVRARTTGLTITDVDAACNVERTLVRTWAMRFTLHMLHADDVRWVSSVMGPVLLAIGRRRRQQVGLDDALCERALACMEQLLEGGPLPGTEILARLRQRGIDVPRGDNAPAHLFGYVAAHGVICRGHDIPSGRPTYALTQQWIGAQSPVDRETALTQLATRYLRAYGPARVEDFATWSGLPMGDARAGWESVAAPQQTVRAGGRQLTMIAASEEIDSTDRNIVRLTGRWDTYVLGYRSREHMLPPHLVKAVADGGIIRQCVLLGGRIIGTWRHELSSATLAARFNMLEPVSRAVERGVRDDLADVARFLGATQVIAAEI
jgi:hypothetical protein